MIELCILILKILEVISHGFLGLNLEDIIA